ncbi:hypothetical protein [Heliophilum fasciatum]|uniref:DUF4247 domain-containing protein n=1 Tax=Heliophilum fasciatum TaxID=35700 RepID=A0A4R2RJJ2_9FIRM|nr:hypothetical protein [Heliophilum fasciatum]MCW2278189.1 hypothetical protein [Heliophilum fasciatum]TCP63990.1 hypothetical protein EDD73_11340 [Heliophilum fasciatum]
MPEKFWLRGSRAVAIAAMLGVLTFPLAGCNDTSQVAQGDLVEEEYDEEEYEEEYEEEDDDSIFVHDGVRYIPYRSFTGPYVSGASLVAKKGDTYVPYTGAKYPTGWNANPNYVAKSSSTAKGTVGQRSSSFGSSKGSSSSFGSASSSSRSGSSSG